MKKILTIIMVLLPFAIFGSEQTVINNLGSGQIEQEAMKLSDWMPWIVAIIIAGMSNFFAWKQIKTSQKVSKDQLDTSMELAKINHNSTIVANNRIQYLKDIRDISSELIAIISLFKTIKANKREIGLPEGEKDFFTNFYDKTCKLIFLLNPNEEISIKVRTNLNDIFKIISSETNNEEIDKLVSELIKDIQTILKNEWERIKGITSVD